MQRITRTILMLLMVAAAARARGAGVGPFAEVLVWQASEETSAIWANAVSQQEFSVEGIQFDWNAGLRTGFAYVPEEHTWDARVYWTYYRTSASSSIPPGQHAILSEFFSTFIANSPSIDNILFTSAAIDWNLLYNTVDLELGHPIAVTPQLLLRPSLGLKIASINQSAVADWANLDPLSRIVAEERMKHNFLGVGPSFGLDATWNVPRREGLALVGSFSGALLAGVWNVEDSYTQVVPPWTLPNTYESFTTSMTNSTLGTLMLRYFCGLEWTRVGQHTITARVGYEMQWWASQQRMTSFQQLPMHGDLTLQGISCGLSICF